MTWTDRVGNLVRGVVVLAIDFTTIGSEFLKQVLAFLFFGDSLGRIQGAVDVNLENTCLLEK